MHTIKFVAQQTGLSQHTIRAWERRYGALSPDRTATNRRLYSAEDVEKLKLLQLAVQAGHSIGRVAGLSLGEVKALLAVSGELKASRADRQAETSEPAGGASSLDECLRAVEQLDADALEYSLTRSAAMLGIKAMIDRVVLPLLSAVGESWREGELRPAHEHMATAILRTFLGSVLADFQPPVNAPRLVVTTPAGQIHEMGALIAAITAASEGWAVLYLGPGLPADEIAGAIARSGAVAVALSVVYPPDDPRLARELTLLRAHVGDAMPILVGGAAARAYGAALAAVGAEHTDGFQEMRMVLEGLRSRGAAHGAQRSAG